MNAYINRLIVLLLQVLLVSCAVTKDYQKPTIEYPSHFSTSEPEGGDTVIMHRKEFFKNEKLLQLIDHAMEKNSTVQLALLNVESAGAILKKVKLNYLPELDAKISGNRSEASKNSLAGISAQEFTSSTVTQDFTAFFGLTWEIDIWGKIKRQKEAVFSEYLQTQEVQKAVQTRLVADVAMGYYNLLMLDSQLAVAKRNIQLGKNTVEILQIQYKYGDSNSFGVLQATAQLEEVKVIQLQIEQAIAQQEVALSILCGYFPSPIERQEQTNSELNSLRMDYDVALLANRPDVFASELNLRAANASVGVAQASLYPTLSLSAQGGLNSLKVSNWFTVPASLFSSVAGGVTQPVFNRGRLKLQEKQAKIDYEKAVIDFRQTVLDAYGEVSIALMNVEKLNEQAKHNKLRELALRQGIETAKTLFKNGMVNYLEVITAENNYLQASLASAVLRREQLSNRIELYRAIGGGWN